jgi:hypothetical protein
MTNSSDKILKERTLNKIRFLEDQLTSLDHYLPETYDYLMRELDLQKCTLVALEVEEQFSMIDDNDKPNEPTST